MNALQYELQQNKAKSKEHLTAVNTLSLDEYLTLKQEDTGFKARIDYYTAVLEDLDEKYYQIKVELYKERTQLYQLRAEIFKQLINPLCDEIIEKIKPEMSDLYTYLALSGDKEPVNTIKLKIAQAIDTDKPIDEFYKFRNLTGSFEPKRPTQLHAESFNQQAKGFERLFNNIYK